MRLLASRSCSCISRRAVQVYSVASNMAGARLQIQQLDASSRPKLDTQHNPGSASDDVSRTADQQLPGSVARLKLPVASQQQSPRDRGAYLYVPSTYSHEQPSPLLVMLHGAGGYAKNTLLTFGSLDVLDEERCLLLVPESRGSTWDMIRGEFGPDVTFIQSAMQQVFDGYSVDPQRCGLAGFSDGASYALSLGLPNGDLFSHIIAFSPGFMRAPSLSGSPKVYISHGTRDAVLNIDFCSRRLVPRLSRMLPSSSELDHVEFDGGHSVTTHVADEALSWFTKGTPIDDSTFSQGPHVAE